MKTYLPRSWIHPALTGGLSKIHGDGIFATAPIARGEKLMEFGGETITTEQIATDNYRQQSVWPVATETHIALPVSDPEPSLDENLNHSCDANTWLSDEVTVIARRDIAAGEEITLDQGTWNFDEPEYTWDYETCGCGALNCRKTLTENDWKRADVQDRYRGHFHPMVQAMIDAREAQLVPGAVLHLGTRTTGIQRATLTLFIATEAWASQRKSWLGKPVMAWLYGRDHAHAYWDLEIEVDEESGADGAPAPSLRLPVDGASFPAQLSAITGTAIVEGTDVEAEASYGNDAPALENNRLEFGAWLPPDKIHLHWTAQYEDWDTKPRKHVSFVFDGPVEFAGIHMQVKASEDAVPLLSHVLPALDQSTLELSWGRQIDYGTHAQGDRRHWREVLWKPASR